MDILIFLALTALFVLPRILSASGKRTNAGHTRVPVDGRLPGQSLAFPDVLSDVPPLEETSEPFPAPSMMDWDGEIEDAPYGVTREELTPTKSTVGEPQPAASPPKIEPLGSSFAFEPGELKRAIIMAEILSPPKALRRR